MAENRAVWGIDIGQAGLKAIRLKYAEQAEQVLAVGFDYIPHPKILSQPDAIPKDLIRQALETFLSRNDVTGDLVSISLPGHSALARFIQLPPVESSKVGDVVKYEARQQIPFALEDVIWDYQTLSGGIVESGFMLGAEVGLFAMKNDQVYEAMEPFNEAKVEIELVQLAPLAMYNVLCYDQLGMRSPEDHEGHDEYTIMLDMGTDNTTLLVTNGEKIWIRNVPVGGNHFTRALTKDMKLTFAKAEHLKCNATKSPDPRAVFQALRPVFNDYVNEIQRSIGYFSSVNREAKISRVVGVGNGFKLAGLQKFLQQNLQYDVQRIEMFNGAVGDTVLNAPVFQENIMSFVVPYGLALQTLKLTRIHTTLLPPEIAVARRIRRKKPWAVVTAASLLLGLATSIMGYANAAGAVSEDRFGKAESDADGFKSKIATEQENYKTATTNHTTLVGEGAHLVGYIDKQHLWMELFRAINECLPRPIGVQRDEEDIVKIPRITVRSVTAERKKDLNEWFEALNESNRKYLTVAERKKGPEGPGYVITLAGEHFYTPKDRTGGGIIFVRDTLVQNLRKQFVEQPDNLLGPVAVAHIGISYPVITFNPPPSKVDWYPKGPPKNLANTGTGLPPGIPGAPGFPAAGVRTPQLAPGVKSESKRIDRTVFTLEFVWKQTLPAVRGLATVEEPATDTGEPGTVPPETTPDVPATSPEVPPGTPPPPGVPGTPPAGVPGTVPAQPVPPGT
jgi:type IV pilus assembly protein PilM